MERKKVTYTSCYSLLTKSHSCYCYESHICKQEAVILKKNVTYQALSNNLDVYPEEVTSTHNGILLESYSLDSTYLSLATTEICLRTHA